MIYLSASSISDFVACSSMYKYRSESSESAIISPPMHIGTAVHTTVQYCWNQPVEAALERVKLELKDRSIDEKGMKKANRCIENFFFEMESIKESLTEDDLIEYYFKEKIMEGVYLVGKMDRVIKSTDTIYDWKTGSTKKKTLVNDIQSIVYYSMYHRIFGRFPNVYVVYLDPPSHVVYQPTKRYIEALFKGIIPKMVSQIKAGLYYKEGYFNGSCYNCPYVGLCLHDQ